MIRKMCIPLERIFHISEDQASLPNKLVSSWLMLPCLEFPFLEILHRITLSIVYLDPELWLPY